jgi:hypothetical protein
MAGRRSRPAFRVCIDDRPAGAVGGAETKKCGMSISDDDITSEQGNTGEGTADGGANPGGHDGGANGPADSGSGSGSGEGTADGGANPGGHDGGDPYPGASGCLTAPPLTSVSWPVSLLRAWPDLPVRNHPG